MWWDLPCLLPLYMQVHCGCVWSLYTSPGWEILPHERHQCLPRKRRGVENPCSFLMGKISQATLKVIKRWWKLKLCIHSFPAEIVSTKMSYFCWCEPAQVPIVTPNCCPFSIWTLGDTHQQLDKKIVPYSQSHCLMLKMWTQVTEERLNGESTAEPFYAKTATKDIFWFQVKVRQGCHLFVIVGWPRLQHKMGKNLVKLPPSSHCHSRMLTWPIVLFVNGTLTFT